jgi:hypothetical protein
MDFLNHSSVKMDAVCTCLLPLLFVSTVEAAAQKIFTCLLIIVNTLESSWCVCLLRVRHMKYA